jgi:hypothetical protein
VLSDTQDRLDLARDAGGGGGPDRGGLLGFRVLVDRRLPDDDVVAEGDFALRGVAPGDP